MKPRQLRHMVGRKVWVRWNGERSGKVVSAPASDTLVVQFMEPHGRHRVPLRDVVGVVWFRKIRPLAEWLEQRPEEGKEA